MGFYAGKAIPLEESASGRAIRMRIDDIGTVWVPKKAINEEESEVTHVGDSRGELVVKHWFAIEKGWE